MLSPFVISSPFVNWHGIRNEVPAIVPATSDLTVNSVWTDRSSSGQSLDFSNVTHASVAVYLTLNSADTGVILEGGGDGAGLALYAFGGVIYFQCGNGPGFLPASNKGVTSWTIPNATDAEYLIEWSANSSTGYAELFINGVSVDVSASYSFGKLAGIDYGGLGSVFSTICGNRGGWSNTGDGDFTNTIVRADIFVDQTVGGA
jgi:hypothetical protein